jgi:UDPglucose 6-dehydrogenase
MRLTVIGTGFVGVVTSAVFAKFGNQVIGLDIDEAKIASLNDGHAPFFEPQLDDLLQEALAKKNLTFTTDYQKAISTADVIFIAVGTPSAPDGTADLKYVELATKAMAPHLKDGAIVALKSTVPPGTSSKVSELLQAHTNKNFFVASLPEFLKEGSAVYDTLNPDRVVIGATEPQVIEILLQLHEPLSGKRIIVSPESAQMAKYSANAYLAQRITFINQIANLCEKNGANIQEVIQAIGADARIGSHYWYPGLGYGGSCFPKDVKELAAYARSVGEADSLLVKIDELNDARIENKMIEFGDVVGGWNGKKVAVLGLSFKPNTNDMREAPSLKVIPHLVEQGATVVAHDPQAMDEAKALLPDIIYALDPYEAAKGAHVIMLLVEWSALTNLDLQKLYSLAHKDCHFIDTRNQYDPQSVKHVGFNYLGIGIKQAEHN